MASQEASWPNVPAIVHDHDAIETRLTKVEGNVSFLSRLFYFVIALIVAVAGLFAVAAMSTPTAAADPVVVVVNPVDVHWPQYSAGWCPGGRGGFIVYWCDGRPYADGTKWHFDTAQGFRCVAPSPDLPQPDARIGVGACGGGW